MSGTWKPLKNQPIFNASTMLLLTDGTVMGQEVTSHRLQSRLSGAKKTAKGEAHASGDKHRSAVANPTARPSRASKKKK